MIGINGMVFSPVDQWIPINIYNIYSMVKYNIYIICKNEEIFKTKANQLNDSYRSKICHIQWIPAEYLTLTQCNKQILKKLNTRSNTLDKSIIAKLGCIAAHRKALLAIYSNQTNNNLILEEDAETHHKLPSPPKASCYMGGWIVPPQITKAGKEKVNIKPKKGMNPIDYDNFQVITTHALFIKTIDESIKLLDMTIKPEKLKNYDIFLANERYFTSFYYPAIFIQGKHTSEISGNSDQSQITINYGL
jgi:hypothetical protein